MILARIHRFSGSSGRGFTFMEVLVAMIFLMAGLVFLFSVFSSSNRGTMDAYRETIAFTLAQEGVEWVGGMGYEELNDILSVPGNSLATRLQLGVLADVDDIQREDGSMIRYPEDYKQFRRLIDIEHYPSLRLMKVHVEVAPKTKFFTRRESVILEKIVGAEYD